MDFLLQKERLININSILRVTTVFNVAGVDKQSFLSYTESNPAYYKDSLVEAGIESHGGTGKEFHNYLMESKEYLKRNQYILPNNNERSLFRRCIDLISLHVCKANTILFNNIRYGYYHRQGRDTEET